MSSASAWPPTPTTEELGSWVVLAPAVGLLAAAGYAPAFAAAAVCALVAATLPPQVGAACQRGGVATSAPHEQCRRSRSARAVVRELARTLRPLLAVVTVLGAAEAAAGLLLVLHLQHELGPGLLAIAWVSLPGGISLAVGPSHTHRLTVRF
ncbi:hypothetical protein [Clavibacter michiganensis]|uniref:hypothetical protein n=1 Tax=Clavibacter michiganensis TaxID=28447 RepID=UPI00293011F5|nr:hypothetical protein [Clavibacter michiganensis]